MDVTKKVLTPVELQLLALVTSERSGREIARLYREETGEPVPFGTLYATLRRMRERGWVQMRNDRDLDGRIRLFRATASGLQAVEGARSYYDELASFGAATR